MSSMLGGATPFSQVVQSLVTQSKLDLLAHLLSTLPYAQGFHLHHPDINDELGRTKEGETEDDLKKYGGTEELLKTFVDKARMSAEEVSQTPSVKRMLTSSGKARPKKKVKSAQDRFDEEVKSTDGVERIYSNAFSMGVDMDISALEVDPVLQTRLSCFRIEGIKREMLARFDPSLVSIAVRPADISTYNPKEPEKSRYYVIQGVHSFKALQSIQREGKLHRLPSMGEGEITVTIVNIEDTELVLYGHLRSNALASTFVKKPQPQVSMEQSNA